MLTHKEYLQLAVDEARSGMDANQGGPFGAIIVINGKVVGTGCNQVTSTNDPTAHAEMVAIRAACKVVNHFQLEGAIIYSNCEPCPMCLSAIYWAGIKTIYYSSDRVDAERIGFDDRFIYDELNTSIEQRNIKMEQILLPEADSLFDEWINKHKTSY